MVVSDHGSCDNCLYLERRESKFLCWLLLSTSLSPTLRVALPTLLTTILDVNEQTSEQVAHLRVSILPLTMWSGPVGPSHLSSLYSWGHQAAASISDSEWPMLLVGRFSTGGGHLYQTWGVQGGLWVKRASEQEEFPRWKGQEGGPGRKHLEHGGPVNDYCHGC